MIIKSIRVRNFRSIKDETLPCEELTVLVGPNGSGKSSFLRALEMFYTVSARYAVQDFYAEDTSQPILITVTFTDLTDEEKELFQIHLEGGELTVEKDMKWPPSRESQKYYGTRLQNPEFDTFRSASSAKERKEAYEALIASGKYPVLPKWTKQDDATEALKKWEDSNPDRCSRQRDEGQFFGFKEVGKHRLERFTQFRLVPAVRDAAEDAAEGRGTVISDIMDLVVRSVLAEREEVKKLREDTQQRYEEIVNPANIPQLQTLASDLTDTLKTYVVDARIDLRWLPLESVDIPPPKADVKLVEDGYPSTVERSGHGLQRAFILTMLQHLAVAQAPRPEDGAEAENIEKKLVSRMPNLILGIEEPELYQHPNRQRHLSKVLAKLATGSIKGVAERTQIIYSTHSPLFVDVERTDQVRAFRKVSGAEGKPKQTKVFCTTLDEVAKSIERAENKPEGTFTGATLRPRLLTLMTPWMNEGFFADVAVLVEGEEDRAAILGNAVAVGHDLESMGISVIPCMGKNNLDKATTIFRNLGIAVYTIWDSDYGNTKKKETDEKKRNHCLLRLFRQPTEDWPEMVTEEFACFKKDLTSTLHNEIGQDVYDTALKACCERPSLDKDKCSQKSDGHRGNHYGSSEARQIERDIKRNHHSRSCSQEPQTIRGRMRTFV